jgi:hypothetical protein
MLAWSSLGSPSSAGCEPSIKVLSCRKRQSIDGKQGEQTERAKQQRKRPSRGFRVIHKVITIVDGLCTKILPVESRSKPTRDDTNNNGFDDCRGTAAEQQFQQ